MNLGDPETSAFSFVEIKKVINMLSMRRISVKVPIIFILDCCRVELKPDGIRFVVDAEIQDLNNFGSAANICIMYSTARGYTASDGGQGSENGAYTGYLLKHLDKVRTISELSTEVRQDLFNDPKYRSMQVRPEGSFSLGLLRAPDKSYPGQPTIKSTAIFT